MADKLQMFPNRFRENCNGVSRRRVYCMILAAIIAYIPILSHGFGINDNIEVKLLRAWFQVRGPREPPDSVVIVRHDPASYRKLTSLTANSSARLHLAEAIEAINAAGAKLIVLDFLFNTEDAQSDERLAKALAASPSVLGIHLTERTDVAHGIPTNKVTVSAPTELLRQSAKAVLDVRVRKVNDVIKHISLAHTRGAASPDDVPLADLLRKLVSHDIAQPKGFDFINYYGEHLAIANISLSDVVKADATTRQLLKDRVVFIGEAGIGPASLGPQHDTFLTVGSESPLYGVAIHATIAANLLDSSWIRRLPENLELVGNNFLTFVLAFTILTLPFLRGVLVVVVAGSAAFAASYFAFSSLYYFIPVLTVFGVIFPSVLLLRWVAAAGSKIINKCKHTCLSGDGLRL